MLPPHEAELHLPQRHGAEMAPVKSFGVWGGIFFFDPLQLDLCNVRVHFIQFHLTAVSQTGVQAARGSFCPPPDSKGSWLPNQLPCRPTCAIWGT